MLKNERKRCFTKKQRTILYLFSGGKCSICRAKLGHSFHADHIKPFSKGGKTALSNGQALCPACNLRKGNKE